jgi:5'-3' exonuclease
MPKKAPAPSVDDKERVALIDADILCYRIGFAYEKETNVGLVKWQLGNTVDRICDSLGTATYRAFLTANDKSNFRIGVFQDYKGNRNLPRPKWYETIRQTLIDDYAAEECFGIEADDALGLAATSPIYKYKCPVIVSLDKDLNQIPGEHYNFAKNDLYSVTKGEGDNFLGRQLLTGDRTDNIPGLDGIGDIKAGRIIDLLEDRKEILETVCDAYKNHKSMKGQDWQKILRRNADLIFIRRYGEERLILPWEENEAGSK